MNQITSKVFYEIATGKILFITSGYNADIQEQPKEYYMKVFVELKDKTIDEVDYIELEYGTLGTIFTNVKSYSVNLVTKTLDFVYFTQAELDTMQQQNQETQDLSNRISSISQYLHEDSTSIADIEESIIQTEINKINGGM